MSRGAILAAVLLGLSASLRAEDWRLRGPRLELLRALVETNSGTESAAGQDKVRGLLIPEFEKLGFKARLDDVGGGHKVLSFSIPGGAPELLLVGHVDTVFPPGSPFQVFGSTGERWTGPGVIDMKGGIVLMLDALSRLKDPALLKKVRVALNDDEETGSEASRAKLDELAKGVPYGLVFEPGSDDGALVSSESGLYWFELRVRGKAAHAGLEPEKGVNACVELAREIGEIVALADPAKHLTINVGTVRGGTKTNVVCPEASAAFDVRYVDPADLARVQEQVRRVIAAPSVRNAGGEASSTELVLLSQDASLGGASTSKLLALAQKAGRDVSGRHVGYGSDANHLAQTGIELLVGLGPYGGGMHTEREFMRQDAYPKRLKLAVSLIRDILRH